MLPYLCPPTPPNTDHEREEGVLFLFWVPLMLVLASVSQEVCDKYCPISLDTTLENVGIH